MPCPGWHRRPVDTYLDLKDRGGLFTHCLEIKLANGTVLRQDAVPEKPSCGQPVGGQRKLSFQSGIA